MDSLARFYTQDIISKILIQSISIINPKVIVDLGIGQGSLTAAAYKKWNNALYLAADVDTLQIKHTTTRLPFVKIFEACGLKNNIGKKLSIQIGSVDVAICNPPYLKISRNKKKSFLPLLKRVGFKNCDYYSFLTSELIFLAQNIALLKEGGELGIILPDGLLTRSEFKLFRQDLLNSHTLKIAIELPDNIFKKADAKTHILIIQKGIAKRESKIDLYKSDLHGDYIDHIIIEKDKLIKRMDFSFHQFNAAENYQVVSLEDLGAVIQRGQLTHDQLKKKKCTYIHTTYLQHSKRIKLPYEKNFLHAYAMENDILLARVGRGCIGKVSYVVSGKALISDCIYRIHVPKKHVNQVWQAFTSAHGQAWLKASSKGVGARVTSKSDLLKFPIRLL